MPNYQKGKIYKLISENNDDFYLGSTALEYLSQRIGGHRLKSQKYPQRKCYEHILNNGGWSEWKIILIENFPCNTKDEFRQREQYWKDLLKPTLNDHNAFGYDEERRNNMKKIVCQKYRRKGAM